MNKLARLARSEIMFEKIRDALECEPRLSRTNIRLPKKLCKFAVQPFKLRISLNIKGQIKPKANWQTIDSPKK